VPAGATCSLYLTTVTGNVTVDGTLVGFGNTFEKNVVASGGTIIFPLCVELLGANHVLGNVVVSAAAGNNPPPTLTSVTTEHLAGQCGDV
jgi:hypothetical protein